MKVRGKKAFALDLDGGVDGVDQGLAIQAKQESKEFQKLQKKLASCNKCGPNKWCKVNKLGTHVTLTAIQLAGWAHSLVQFFICF